MSKVEIKLAKKSKKFDTHDTIRGADPELWKLLLHDKVQNGGTIGEIFNKILRAYYGVRKD